MITGTLSDFSIIGPALSGFASKAIRGVMANLQAGLALAFQINPQEVEFEKQTNYDVDNPTGYDGPIVTWVSGGQSRIRFSLFFDGTQAAVDSGLTLMGGVPDIRTGSQLSVQDSRIPIPSRGKLGAPPFIGVRGQIAVIESFLHPQVPLVSLLGSRDRPRSPPECFLILGTRFWRTRVLSAPIKEILYDKLLTPLRMTTNVELLVLEEGEINDLNQIERKALAIGESTLGFTQTFLTVF